VRDGFDRRAIGQRLEVIRITSTSWTTRPTGGSSGDRLRFTRAAGGGAATVENQRYYAKASACGCALTVVARATLERRANGNYRYSERKEE
jgi:hypothetical protein